MQLAELFEQRLELDAAMGRCVGGQATDGLRQLPLHPDSPSASGLVPRDRDVDESLQEVALSGRRRAPCVLELLVGREVLARADQLETAFKS